MARKQKLYLPLDVEFFDDDKILAVGEKAGWLYLALCCEAKRRMSDGWVTKRQVIALQIPGWQARVATLVTAGLVVPDDPWAADRWLIASFLDWNLSAAQVMEGRERDRKRKSFQPRSARNDSGTTPESERTLREVEVEVRDREEVEVEASQRQAQEQEPQCAHGRAAVRCVACIRASA